MSLTYDLIFAGGESSLDIELCINRLFLSLQCLGGATACITAGRLAEADPNLKILVCFLYNIYLDAALDKNYTCIGLGSWPSLSRTSLSSSARTIL